MSDLAQRWLAYYVRENMAHLESRSELEMLIQSDLPRAWAVIRELVSQAPDDKTLGAIGAGPLETMLRNRGSAMVDQVIAEAQQDGRFKKALSHVWEFDIDDDVWEKIYHLFAREPS